MFIRLLDFGGFYM